MSSPRQEPVIYEIFKEKLEEYAAVWKGLSKRKKMLFLVADRFDKIHDLRRFILAPNRLDFTSVQGMNRWNAYTWNCIVDLVDKGFTNGEWQSFVDLGMFVLSWYAAFAPKKDPSLIYRFHRSFKFPEYVHTASMWNNG